MNMTPRKLPSNVWNAEHLEREFFGEFYDDPYEECMDPVDSDSDSDSGSGVSTLANHELHDHDREYPDDDVQDHGHNQSAGVENDPEVTEGSEPDGEDWIEPDGMSEDDDADYVPEPEGSQIESDGASEGGDSEYVPGSEDGSDSDD